MLTMTTANANPALNANPIDVIDPEIAAAIAAELNRQESHI